MRQILSIYFIFLSSQFINAQTVDSNYVPPIKKGMNKEFYEHYRAILFKGHDEKNHWDIAVGLGNLGSEAKIVYPHLYKFINSGNTENIMQAKRFCISYKVNNLVGTFDKISKGAWLGYCRKCDSLMSDTEYNRLNKLASEENTVEEKIDSTNWNREVIAQLKKIIDDDQKYRSEIMRVEKEKGEKASELVGLWKKQNKLDEENFIQIEEIIKKYGYPGKSLVGDMQGVALMVIHHYPKIEVHEKYLPLIEKAYMDKEINGGLEMFTYRIKMAKLSEKK
jgi:hypothetical protein